MLFSSSNEVIDKHTGPIGAPKRDAFKDKYALTFSAMPSNKPACNATDIAVSGTGGHAKASFSKLEHSLTDARFETVMKVFMALNAKVGFSVELINLIY